MESCSNVGGICSLPAPEAVLAVGTITVGGVIVCAKAGPFFARSGTGASSADRMGLMRRIGCVLANSFDESGWQGGDESGRRLDLCIDCEVDLVLRRTSPSKSELKQISFRDAANGIGIHLLRSSSDAADVLKGGDTGAAIAKNYQVLIHRSHHVLVSHVSQDRMVCHTSWNKPHNAFH